MSEVQASILVEVKNHDLSDDMLNEAIEATKTALTELTEVDGGHVSVAEKIKKHFDLTYGPKWHCVVGRHFASHVTYEPNHYLCMKIGKEVVLLYKSGGVAEDLVPEKRDGAPFVLRQEA